MKILKNAEQRNMVVDKAFYTSAELREKFNSHLFMFIDTTNFDVCYDYDMVWDDTQIRIFTEDLQEIKVIYDKEYREYRTVGITTDGEVIAIQL